MTRVGGAPTIEGMTPIISSLAGLALFSLLGARPGPQSRAVSPERIVDVGTLAVTVAGRRAGMESFQIVGAGEGFEIRTATRVASGRMTTFIRGSLRVDRSYRPQGGSFETASAGQITRQTLEKKGDLLELTTRAAAGKRAATFTRPRTAPDVYFGTDVLAHLTALCHLGGEKEQQIAAFPAAPLRISPAARRKYPQTKLGAPSLELTDVTADLARTMRIEAVCDGPKLVAVRQGSRRLTAVRAGYEEVASALEARSRKKPPTPETLVELPRRIPVPATGGAGAATLACTLLVPRTHAGMKRDARGAVKAPAPEAQSIGGLTFTPEGPQPLPAILFVTGSGPQDRDEDSSGPGDMQLSLFKIMADRLGQSGIASLRCDDRGAGKSSGTFRRATLDTFVSDARAVVAALRKEGSVDPDRIGLVGHSEGGLVSTLLAAGDTRLGAAALLAAPGRPLDVILLEVTEGAMRRFGFAEEEIQGRLAEDRATYDAIRVGKPLPKTLTAAERKALGESKAWLASRFKNDPLAATGKLAAMPVLVAQGGNDVQASGKDAEAILGALSRAGNHHVLYRPYPPLNHLFAAGKAGELADYTDPQAEIDAAFLRDATEFLRESLRAPPPPAAQMADGDSAPARPAADSAGSKVAGPKGVAPTR